MFCAKIDFLSSWFEENQFIGVYNGILSVVNVEFSVNVELVCLFTVSGDKKKLVSNLFIAASVLVF